jgi:hypothetical protein
MTILIYQKFINREDCWLNPHLLYIFGDNELRRGYGGQAKAMRGEPNAHGIATLRQPHDPWTDDQFEHNKAVIDKDVEKLIARIPQYMGIVFPADGVGTGLSRLDVEAPETYAYLSKRLSDAFKLTEHW